MSKRRGGLRPSAREAKGALADSLATEHLIIGAVLLVLVYGFVRWYARRVAKQRGETKPLSSLDASWHFVKTLVEMSWFSKAVGGLKKFWTGESESSTYIPSRERNTSDRTHSASDSPKADSGFSPYANKLVYHRESTSYIDRDGDVADEFYEEGPGGLLRITRGLRKQGMLPLPHPTINPAVPLVLQAVAEPQQTQPPTHSNTSSPAPTRNASNSATPSSRLSKNHASKSAAKGESSASGDAKAKEEKPVLVKKTGKKGRKK